MQLQPVRQGPRIFRQSNAAGPIRVSTGRKVTCQQKQFENANKTRREQPNVPDTRLQHAVHAVRHLFDNFRNTACIAEGTPRVRAGGMPTASHTRQGHGSTGDLQ